MAVTKVEIAIGAINGVNLTYFTTTAYLSSTVRAILNGQMLPPGCITEVDSNTGEVLLDPDAVPRVGDVLMLLWTDSDSIISDLENAVQGITGYIKEDVGLEASLLTDVSLSGQIVEEDIFGALSDEVGLGATLIEETSIRGILKECNS